MASPPSTSTDKAALERMEARILAAIGNDSLRPSLTSAREAGGPDILPHLVAVAASKSASRICKGLLDHGWPAQSVDELGQSALWHATNRNLPNLARTLLAAGADPLHINLGGSPFGEAAMRGDTDLIELMRTLGEKSDSGSLTLSLNRGLWTACATTFPQSARGCRALVAAGASWSFQPAQATIPANCAQLAAGIGPLEILDDPAARPALAVRHPPKKGRGSWSEWRATAAPGRVALIERWILLDSIPEDTPTTDSARRLRL